MSASSPRFPLGFYTLTPNPGSATQTAAFRSDYAGFTTAMGAAPSYTDAFIDNSQPISQWVASATWDAWAYANTAGAASMTPVIGLPLTSSAPGSAGIDASFRAWAAGSYDGVLSGMVQAWAADGFTTQVWRPGWEMNLTGSAWYAGGSAQTEADFVAAFQHIYTVLHAAAQADGVKVTVLWNPTAGTNSGVNAIAKLYPGDAYVDAVAADVYADAWPYSLNDYGAHAGSVDATMAAWLADPANRVAYWNNPAENRSSPDASNGVAMSLPQLLAFTEAHGKPFAVPETGAGNSNGGHDVADDAAFPAWLSGQLAAAQAAGTTIDFVNIWDGNGGGNYAFSAPGPGSGSTKPQEEAAWAQDFGAPSARPTVPATALTVSNDADLFGSGRSDIILDAGTLLGDWQVNGLTRFASGALTVPGPGWHPAATGDFDGNGTSDILFQDDDGSFAIWLMSGRTITTSATSAGFGASWHAVATGDFGAVGRSAVLLQNDNGAVAISQANGTALSPLSVVANPGTAWHAVATGNFDGDGKSDILLQNNDGSVAVWDMNGATVAASAVVANPGPGWRAVGTGDFDGSGKSGILLQNDDGTVAIWQMNGTAMTSSRIVADPGPNWHAVDVGDFNGDGKSDILFQNDDGTLDEWLMNGSTIASSGTVANPGANWAVLGQGGMNFINGNATTGEVTATILTDDFDFASPTPGAHEIAGFDPLHDAVTLDQTRFGSYPAVLAHETQVPAGTMLNLGNGSTLTLEGVLPSALSAHNFI